MIPVHKFMGFLTDFEIAAAEGDNEATQDLKITLIALFQGQVDNCEDTLLAAYKVALNNNASEEHLQSILKMLNEKNNE